jgi:hypothetical protein
VEWNMEREGGDNGISILLQKKKKKDYCCTFGYWKGELDFGIIYFRQTKE